VQRGGEQERDEHAGGSFWIRLRRPLEMVTRFVRKTCAMNPDTYYMFIPIVAIVVTFAFPVVLVATFKWFKLKDRELTIDAELRKTAGVALEQRVQRLESVLLALDADLRAKLSATNAPPAQLMEPPATSESGQPGPDLLRAGKSREG